MGKRLAIIGIKDADTFKKVLETAKKEVIHPEGIFTAEHAQAGNLPLALVIKPDGSFHFVGEKYYTNFSKDNYDIVKAVDFLGGEGSPVSEEELAPNSTEDEDEKAELVEADEKADVDEAELVEKAEAIEDEDEKAELVEKAEAIEDEDEKAEAIEADEVVEEDDAESTPDEDGSR